MTSSWVAVVAAGGWAQDRWQLGLDTAFVRDVTRAFVRDVLQQVCTVPDVTAVIVVSDVDIEHQIADDRARYVVDPGAATFESSVAAARHLVDRSFPGCGLLAVAPDLPAIDVGTLRGTIDRAGEAHVVVCREAAGERAAVVAVASDHDDALPLAMRAPTRQGGHGPVSLTRVRTWSHLSTVLADGAGSHTVASWQQYGASVCDRFGVMTGRRGP
ncbi:MAG: hypothetical protein ABWY58_10255 [Aeromicrobium sp.]